MLIERDHSATTRSKPAAPDVRAGRGSGPARAGTGDAEAVGVGGRAPSVRIAAHVGNEVPRRRRCRWRLSWQLNARSTRPPTAGAGEVAAISERRHRAVRRRGSAARRRRRRTSSDDPADPPRVSSRSQRRSWSPWSPPNGHRQAAPAGQSDPTSPPRPSRIGPGSGSSEVAVTSFDRWRCEQSRGHTSRRREPPRSIHQPALSDARLH